MTGPKEDITSSIITYINLIHIILRLTILIFATHGIINNTVIMCDKSEHHFKSYFLYSLTNSSGLLNQMFNFATIFSQLHLSERPLKKTVSADKLVEPYKLRISWLVMSCVLICTLTSTNVRADLREQLEQMKKLSGTTLGNAQPTTQDTSIRPATIDQKKPTVISKESIGAFEKESTLGETLFKGRCKSAGVVIKAKVENVGGIRLNTTREDRSLDRYYDRDWPDAGLPIERVGKEFIASFLDFYFSDNDMSPGFPSHSPGNVLMDGFKYVDVKQTDGSFLRYRLASKSPSEGMTSERISSENAARYAVTITPLGTSEERKHWLAGALVSVTDTKSQKIMGELRTFSYVPPSRLAEANLQQRYWMNKQTCPSYLDIQNAQVRIFLINVVAN
jgi:hypothetical protein